MIIDELEILEAEQSMNDILIEQRQNEIEKRLYELTENVICSATNTYVARAKVFVYNNNVEFYVDVVLNEDDKVDDSAVALCANSNGVEVACRDTFCFTRSDTESIQKIQLLNHVTMLLKLGALDDLFSKELAKCADFAQLCTHNDNVTAKIEDLYNRLQDEELAIHRNELQVGSVLYYLPDVPDGIKLYSLDVAVAKIVNVTAKFIDIVDADGVKTTWKKRLGKDGVAQQLVEGKLICKMEA